MDFWYTTPEGIKEKFEEYNQFDNLKDALLYDGIIFEYQFDGFPPSTFLEHGLDSLNELFGDFEEYKKREYTCIGHEVEDQGWMYCLFDMNIYDFEEVKKLIETRFSQDNNK